MITQGASGTGSGTVAFSTGVNVSTDQRSAQIAVGPAAATIRQDGLVANNCGAGGPTGLEASRSTGCRG